MTNPSPAQVLEFAGFRMDLAGRSLTGPDGAPVILKPRVFDTLAVLATRAGELVTRRTLMDEIWPNLVVEENNLNQAIVSLRRALGESPDGTGFIATVPGRGYQFVAPVVRAVADAKAADATAGRAEVGAAGAPSPPADGAGRRALTPPRLAGLAALIVAAAALAALALWPRPPQLAGAPNASIAVLPFLSISPDPEQEYFSDGLTEEVLNQLSLIPDLRVIARTSSFQFKGQSPDAREVGQKLGVSHILEGSVRRAGQTLRVTAQLIDTSSGSGQWSAVFDRQLDDVFAIQQEIAAAVARELSVALRRSPSDRRWGGTSNFEAYDHYLRGTALVARNNVPAYEGAIAALNQAVAADPAYGVAWAALADAAHMLALYEPARSAHLRPLHETALARALATSPDRWEVHAQHGEYLMRKRDWQGAAAAFEAAERLAPSDLTLWSSSYGDFLAYVGRTREAAALFLAARDRDPLNIYVSMGVSWHLDIAGRPQEASAEYHRALSLGGDRNLGALVHLARLLRVGDQQALRAYLADFPDRRPGRQQFARQLADAWQDRDAALALIRSVRTNPDFTGANNLPGFAPIAAHFGDAELALALLREDYFERGGYFAIFLWSADLAEARRTAGFLELVRDLGLAAYWRQGGQWNDYCAPVDADELECH